jgi:uncharacterized membrane protein YraQ (UPF0718 family)
MHGIVWPDILTAFLALLFQVLPFLLLGSLLSAFLEKKLPVSTLPVLIKKIGSLRYPFCAVVGMAFPVCECAALPVARMLHRRGLPLSCCVIFLLASPTINPLAFISTWAAFQNQLPLTTAIVRAVSVATLALSVGLLTNLHKTDDILRPLRADDPFEARLHELSSSWSHVISRAVAEFIDLASYLVMGAFLAAILTTGINRSLLYELGQFTSTSILVMMAASFALSLCSSSDAFVIAPVIGIPWAAKIAFLIIGPLIDLKLLVLYASFFRKEFLLKMTLLLLAGTFILAHISSIIH